MYFVHRLSLSPEIIPLLFYTMQAALARTRGTKLQLGKDQMICIGGFWSSHAPVQTVLPSLAWYARERASCLQSALGLTALAKTDRPVLPSQTLASHGHRLLLRKASFASHLIHVHAASGHKGRPCRVAGSLWFDLAARELSPLYQMHR